jgi:uncharacterized protein (TIGR00369 family)
MTDISDTIRASFSRQSLMVTFAAQLAEVSPGTVVITAPILAASRQQHGFAHAGLTFALGDSAAGYSALSVLPPGYEVMTAEMKINLLAPGKGDYLRATGRILKSGRRLIVVAADVHAVTDARETLVAVLQGTIVPLEPQARDTP